MTDNPGYQNHPMGVHHCTVGRISWLRWSMAYCRCGWWVDTRTKRQARRLAVAHLGGRARKAAPWDR